MTLQEKIAKYDLLSKKYQSCFTDKSQIDSEIRKDLWQHLYSLTKDIEGDDEKFLALSFQKHSERGEFHTLDLLIEFIRAEGIFLKDQDEKQDKLFELILLVACQSIDNPNTPIEVSNFWFSRQVYDIVFHQIRLAEYSAMCSNLYFKLTSLILEPKFYKFLNDDGRSHNSYKDCLYFIEMSDNWFIKRKSEFIVLKREMQRFIQDTKSDAYFSGWADIDADHSE